MPFNDPAKNVMLDALDEAATQITHIGAHTLTDPGTGTNANSGEAAGGSYARVAVTWAAAASAAKANSGALLIDVPVGTYGFLTFWNASTGNTNNYRGYAPINGTVRGFGTVDSAGATADAIQSAGHGLSDTDRVMVMNVLGESLPTGLTEGVIYFVVTSATNTFELSLTSGGASVDITGQGELYWQKIIPETYASPGQISVAISALILDLLGV